MSEFVELGGYIVSGEPLVYPDNTTMTGDGTVESPFGVKSTDLYVQSPLFTGTSGTSAYIGWNNETVLYSDLTGRPTSPGQYIDLSESPLNFEYIEVYLNGSTPTGSNNIANGYEKIPCIQIETSNGLEFHKEFVGTVGGTTSTVHDMGCGYSGTSGTRWTKWYGYSYNVSNKNTDFNNNTHLNIWQVVGVNRKV